MCYVVFSTYSMDSCCIRYVWVVAALPHAQVPRECPGFDRTLPDRRVSQCSLCASYTIRFFVLQLCRGTLAVITFKTLELAWIYNDFPFNLTFSYAKKKFNMFFFSFYAAEDLGQCSSFPPFIFKTRKKIMLYFFFTDSSGVFRIHGIFCWSFSILSRMEYFIHAERRTSEM